jgi:3-oxoacyl-(acyl-carrier-protein) synthase
MRGDPATPAPAPPGLVTLAEAVCESGDLAAEGRRTVSFYADPVAWLVVSAVEAALAAAPDDVRRQAAEVGALAVSGHGTRHTMRSVAAAAERGRVSPLRFAGANPGSLAGLLCITLGFRGPSLLVCMPPDAARAAVPVIASGWLTSGQCRYVAVAEHTVDGERHTVTGRILESPPPGQGGRR